MKINFITRYHNPAAAISGGMAAVQGALGIVQTIAADAKLKRLRAKRTAYKTPEEYYEIMQAAQSMAQSGFDPFTLNFLTNQTDRAFSSSVGAATRLGANPNDLSMLLDNKMQGVMKIGAENHRLNMENFSRFLSAKDVIGQNKAAEWKSQQDMIKDDMQAAAADKAAGIQNIGSAANSAISLGASSQTSDLYKQILDAVAKLKGGQTAGATGGGDSMDVMTTMMGALGGG